MENIKITPKQMVAITSRMNEIYPTIYSINKPLKTHYEHIILENGMFKIGFIPGEENSKTLMNIKIAYKGNIK